MGSCLSKGSKQKGGRANANHHEATDAGEIKEEDLKAIFHEFDLNGDGFIQAGEDLKHHREFFDSFEEQPPGVNGALHRPPSLQHSKQGHSATRMSYTHPPSGEGSRQRRGSASSASIRAGPSGIDYYNLKWGREMSWLPREADDVSHPMQPPLQPATGMIRPEQVSDTRSAERNPSSQDRGSRASGQALRARETLDGGDAHSMPLPHASTWGVPMTIPEASNAHDGHPLVPKTEPVSSGRPTAQPVSPQDTSIARPPSEVASQHKRNSAPIGRMEVPEQSTVTVNHDRRHQSNTNRNPMRPSGTTSKQPGFVPYNQRAPLVGNATPSMANVKEPRSATRNLFRVLPVHQQRGTDYYTSQDEPGIARQSLVSSNNPRHERENNVFLRRRNRKEAREPFQTETFAVDNGFALSRRARKRLRAKERHREHQEATNNKSARSPPSAYVLDSKRFRHNREQRLQLSTTLTAAHDHHASTYNVTAHLQPPKPHHQIVPIQGVSNMGSAPPTESSGWRKPENDHYSWFRNQQYTKQPTSTQYANLYPVLSGSSGTGDVGKGETPTQHVDSSTANPVHMATKPAQPPRDTEHVGSMSWNIGPSGDKQPSKDIEQVNATSGTNVSELRRKQTAPAAVKKPGTKPNTGGEGSNTVAPAGNPENNTQPSNHDDNNNSNLSDDDDDVRELKPTKEELEDALKPIYGDPAIAGFAMSVGENNLFQLGSKLERRCRSNLALAKRDLNKAIAQKSDIPRKVSDRLNKLAKTLTDLDTDVKLMSTALEKNAKDVKDLADELTYIRRYFMTKVQDIHFGLNWDIPTGNTPPASEHGEPPHQGVQPATNSQAQSAAPSRRYSFEVVDGNQRHQQQQNPIEEVRNGGNTAPVTNATDNHNANAVLDIVDDGNGNNFNMNIDRTTGLLMFNGEPTFATAQLPHTQQQSAGQDRTQQQLPQPLSIQVRRPQGYKPSEAVNAITISEWRRTFEGRADENVSLFLEEFEIHCRANKIDPSEWANLLRLRLNGNARELTADLPLGVKEDYHLIKEFLIKNFKRVNQHHTALEKIQSLRYTSFNEMLTTLTALVPKAYPDYSQEVRDVMTFKAIMEKLPKDLFIELKRQKCTTLNQLINLTPDTEAFIRDIRGTETSQPAQRVNATYLNEEFTNVGIVGTDLAIRDAPRPSSRDQPPPQRYKANRRTTTQPQQQSRRPATQPYYGQSGRNIRPDYQSNRPQYQQTTRGNPNLICGHCGKPGHCTLDCRVRQHEQDQERNRDNDRYDHRTQRFNTAQQSWRPRRQDLPIYCNNCDEPGHVAMGCRNRNRYTQQQIDIMPDDGVDYATNQMQHLQLAQPQSRHNPYQQQPQPYMQPAQQQQGTNQQPTAGQASNPNPITAIQQTTGNEQPLGSSEPTATRSFTDEDFRKMESKLELMINKVYQKQDQENPSTDILATLTRHEDGTEPPYIPVDYRLAIIPAIVQGYKCNALFDSGSTITVAPIAMADILKIQLEDSDRSITAVTGHTAEVTKKGQVRLTIAGHTRDVEMFFTGNFLGTKNPYDFIIGVDVMRSFPDATISVRNRQLTIGTNTISWKTKAESMQEGRKVFLLQEANIAPHTAARVAALIDKSRGDVTQSVSIEQAGKHPATVTPAVSLVDMDNRCELMLRNPTNAPIIIRPYTVVAQAFNLIVEDDGTLSEWPEITADTVHAFSKGYAMNTKQKERQPNRELTIQEEVQMWLQRSCL